MNETHHALSGMTEIVARQYHAWVYPKPVEDMQAAIDGGYYEFGTPRLFRPLLWPERRSLQGLKVLIAGCGTNQAAFNALSLPEASFKSRVSELLASQVGQVDYWIKAERRHLRQLVATAQEVREAVRDGSHRSGS